MNKVTKKASDQNKNLSDWLGEVAEARRNMAIDEATQSMEKFVTAIKLIDFKSADYDNETGFREQAEQLNEMAEALRTGKMSFADYEKELANVYNNMYKVGEASTELGRRIKEALDMAREGASSEEIIRKLTAGFERATKAAGNSAEEFKKSKSEIDEITEALKKYNGAEKENVSTLGGALEL